MLGAFNILKPTGWTSSDVVVKVRNILRSHFNDKSIKVGHLGTLDPAGSGVLPIVFGKATRLFDYYQSCKKLYRTTFQFGKTTDTLDSYGKITAESDVIPDFIDIKEKINDFIGVINQLPPIFSSISVNGIRAYDASRKGMEITLPLREVQINYINILGYENGELRLDISCGGGTYIRSICRDLAASLNTVAYMSSIIRLENKGFLIENSITMDELSSNIDGNIIRAEEILKDIQSVNLREDEGKKLLNGINIDKRNLLGDYVVFIDGKLFGICTDGENNIIVKIRLWE